MTLQLALIALIASAGIYGAVAYWKSRNINSIKQLFHIESVRDGSLSIVAGNLTLGTGLFYIASLARSQALFALLAPLGVLLGYILLGRIISSLSLEVQGNNHTMMDHLRTGIGGRHFYKFISIIIVLTYMILIPFEIYVSSSLFASVLPADQSDDLAIVFAVVLFTVVVLYSATGGLRGVVATDIMQLLVISIMLIIVLGGAYYYAQEAPSTFTIGFLPNGDLLTISVLAASSFVTAVATQMYNIINITVGSSFDSKNQLKLFRLAGWVLFCAFVLFVVTGLATQGFGESRLAGIDLLLNEISSNGEAFSLIVFLVVFGMVAVLISTADSGIMAISHMAYENVFNNDSYAEYGGRHLLIVRLVFIIGLNTLSAIPLILIFKTKPDLVALLLTSISALTVAAPFMVSSALNIARYKQCLIFDRRVSSLVILFILIIWGVSIWRTLSGDNETGNYLILSGILIGLLYFKIDGARSKKMQKYI